MFMSVYAVVPCGLFAVQLLRLSCSGGLISSSTRLLSRFFPAHRLLGLVRGGSIGQETTHVVERNGFVPCRLRRQGQKNIRFWEMCYFLAWVPQASKKTLGKQTNKKTGSL
jgi:hypothetical protein